MDTHSEVRFYTRFQPALHQCRGRLFISAWVGQGVEWRERTLKALPLRVEGSVCEVAQQTRAPTRGRRMSYHYTTALIIRSVYRCGAQLREASGRCGAQLREASGRRFVLGLPSQEARALCPAERCSERLWQAARGLRAGRCHVCGAACSSRAKA